MDRIRGKCGTKFLRIPIYVANGVANVGLEREG
jgi:hypothetical protein